MKCVYTWLLCNKLSLNVLKTKYVVFQNFQNKSEIYNNVSLFVNEKEIEKSSVVTYLGVLLDEHLTWDNHINYISSKISRNIGILYRIKYFVPLRILFMMYNAFILPHIMYCIIIWANQFPSKLEKIYRLQKKALRICSNSDYYAPSKPIFNHFQTLNIFDINNLKICTIMQQYLLNSLPEYLMQMFSLNFHIHDYNTRSNQLFHQSKVTSHALLKSIRFVGPTTWNSLPPSLRNIQFVNSFKNKYKHLLLSQYS